MYAPCDGEEGAMSHSELKDTIDIIKGVVVEIAGFGVAILYFGYRLLAGMYVLGRLEAEVVSDTPFTDKCWVRSTLKLKNTGEATLKVTDARLWIFTLDADGRPEPWPAVQSNSIQSRSKKTTKSGPPSPRITTKTIPGFMNETWCVWISGV